MITFEVTAGGLVLILVKAVPEPGNDAACLERSFIHSWHLVKRRK